MGLNTQCTMSYWGFVACVALALVAFPPLVFVALVMAVWNVIAGGRLYYPDRSNDD